MEGRMIPNVDQSAIKRLRWETRVGRVVLSRAGGKWVRRDDLLQGSGE
jgi:hypothetical protein